MPHLETPAIVLSCVDYSETSQIAHLLTPGEGKIRVIAKGIRRGRSFATFDLFTHCEVVVLRKTNPGDELGILVELAVHSSFPGIRRGIEPLLAALLGIEIAVASAQEGHADHEAFALLLEYLHTLDDSSSRQVRPVVLLYLLHFLRTAGLLPRFEACLSCDRPSEDSRSPLVFVAHEGGFLCGSCAETTTGVEPVRPATLSILKSLVKTTRGPDHSVRLPPASLREMETILLTTVEAALDRRLRIPRVLLPRFRRSTGHGAILGGPDAGKTTAAGGGKP
jgi:DNA repair protein RecO (recombination protein O)